MQIEYMQEEKNMTLSFDGTTKSSEGKAQDFPYWDDASPETERVKQRVLAQASPEAIQFWNATRKAPDKIDASTLTPDEWQARRKDSIGSSAASHVTGDCPFENCTPLDLYNEKVGNKPLFTLSPEDERSKQDLFDFGHVMETYLHGWVRRRWPNSKLYIDTNIYSAKDRPYLTANLDGMLQLPDGSWVHIEFKTATKEAQKKYDNGNIPMYYKRQLIQCQHILNVWVSYIVVFFDRDNVISRRYERDLDVEMEQVQMMDDFWNGHVLARIPPDVNIGPAANVIKAIRNYGGGANTAAPEVVLPPNMLDTVKEISDIDRQLAALREQEKILKEQRQKRIVPIITAMGSATSAKVDGTDAHFKISYNPSKPKKTVDLEKLENEYNSVYRDVVSVAAEGARPFKVKEVTTA